MAESYKLDLSFVDRYDKDMSKFGEVRSASVPFINDRVIAATESFYDYEAQESVRAEYEPQVPALNDAVLEREGFTREDMEAGRLPAYMDSLVHNENFGDVNHQDNIAGARENLYDAVYHVDDVLSADTLQALGDEYSAYRKERMAAEKRANRENFRALAKDTATKDGHVYYDDERGNYVSSIDGPNHDLPDDGYHFDEFG